MGKKTNPIFVNSDHRTHTKGELVIHVPCGGSLHVIPPKIMLTSQTVWNSLLGRVEEGGRGVGRRRERKTVCKFIKYLVYH